jgi:RHS repeat-associated protein
LTGVRGPLNQRQATYRYDTAGYVTESKLANDVNTHTFSVSANHVDIQSPLGTERRIYSQIADAWRVVGINRSCVGCATLSSTYAYDANGFMDVKVDFKGVATDHDYNARGLLVKRVDASNDMTGTKRSIQTEWHATLPVPSERSTYDSANTMVAKSTWTYNARGQALSHTLTDPVLAVSRATTTTYCEQADITAGTCPLLGLIKTVNGPRTDVSDVTTYTYRMADDASCAATPSICPYRKGDLWKVTNALGHVIETLRYDGAGRPLSTKDASGVRTDLEYHPRGWLAARKVRGTDDTVETDDQITRIDYYLSGLVKRVTQPDGAFTFYTYDPAHRLTDIADNEGNTIHYTLDNAGHRTGEETKDEQGALLRTLLRVYNLLGQLETQADAESNPTDFTYDANGNADTVTDALSRVTDNDYDPLNRLRHTLQDVGGIEAETTFAYDAQDSLTKVTDPKGLDTTYAYNGLGDLLELSSPDTGITTYTYDSGGNRKTQVDARGITTTYSYDALNRLTAIAYSDGSPGVTYAYDTASRTACVSIGGDTDFLVGRLSKMTDASGSTQYCYDRFGNLAGKGGVAGNVKYLYTLSGRLSGVTYPNNTTVDYVRDGQGRVTEIGVKPTGGVRQILLGQATYYPFGPAAEWVYGNGRLMHRSLNQNYQPGFVEDGFPGGISIGYQFDEVGNLKTLRHANQSDPPRQVFGYDDLNRLTEVKDGVTLNLLQGYGYDDTGNRTSATEGLVTTNYAYPATSHRLDAVGATARTYDAIGNTVAIGGTAKEFGYNAANRMHQVKQGGVETMTYTYNGKGEQVSQTSSAGTVRSFYDEAGHWLGDYNGSTPIQQVVWLDDLPVGLMTGTGATHKLYYVEPDALGTPRVVIDPSRGTQGTAIWNWDLAGEAFGNTAPNQDPDGDTVAFVFNMRFPGQRYDAASGLNYNYFRDYEPSTGKYVESDPVGLNGGISTYGYARANPLSFTDPLGLRSRVCCKGISILGYVGVRHCYVEQDSGGARTTWGLFGNTRGPTSTYGSVVRNDGFDNGGDCGPWNEECNTDECVRTAVQNYIGYGGQTVYRFATGPNSNTFAGVVARQCQLRKPSFIGVAPAYDDPPARPLNPPEGY